MKIPIADARLLRHHPAVRLAVRAAASVWVLVLVVGVGLWFPVWRRHARLEREIGDRRTALAGVVRAALLHQTYTRTRELAGSLEAKLASPEGQAALVGRLGRLAASHGLKILGTSFADVRAPAGVIAVAQEVRVSGGYPEVRKFLTGLHGLPGLIAVQRVRLDRPAERGGDLQAEIRLVSFQRDAGPAAAVNEGGR